MLEFFMEDQQIPVRFREFEPGRGRFDSEQALIEESFRPFSLWRV